MKLVDSPAPQIDLSNTSLTTLLRSTTSCSFSLKIMNALEKEDIHYVIDLLPHRNLKQLLEDHPKLSKFVNDRNLLCLKGKSKLEILQEFKAHLHSPPTELLADLDKFLDYHHLEREFPENREPIGDSSPYYSIAFSDSLIEGAIAAFLDTLNEKERHVFKSRLIGEKTLEEAGVEVKITRERVRQIEMKLAKTDLPDFFSPYRSYIARCFKDSIAKSMDPIAALSSLMRIFGNRSKLAYFLTIIKDDEKTVESISIKETGSDLWLMNETILLSHPMPISVADFKGLIAAEFQWNSIQIDLMMKEQEGRLFTISGNHLVLIPKTKYLAVANVSLNFPNGIHWQELAQKAHEQFPTVCENIRKDHLPDSAITDNKSLYRCGVGTWKNWKFSSITTEQERTTVGDSLLAAEKATKLDAASFDRFITENGLSSRYQRLDLVALAKKLRLNVALASPLDEVRSILKKIGTPLSTMEIQEQMVEFAPSNVPNALEKLRKQGEAVKVDGGKVALMETSDFSPVKRAA